MARRCPPMLPATDWGHFLKVVLLRTKQYGWCPHWNHKCALKWTWSSKSGHNVLSRTTEVVFSVVKGELKGILGFTLTAWTESTHPKHLKKLKIVISLVLCSTNATKTTPLFWDISEKGRVIVFFFAFSRQKASRGCNFEDFAVLRTHRLSLCDEKRLSKSTLVHFKIRYLLFF